jgi:hypothetical protein
MKSILLALAVASSFSAQISLHAEESPKFLEVGKIYEIRLMKDQKVVEGLVNIGRARILEAGGGGWYRVEYSAIRERGIDLPATKAEARGSADVWLNFAHVVAVVPVKGK